MAFLGFGSQRWHEIGHAAPVSPIRKCPYRPPILFAMYSSTLRRTAGGTFGDERIRLMTLAEGPALLSRLRKRTSSSHLMSAFRRTSGAKLDVRQCTSGHLSKIYFFVRRRDRWTRAVVFFGT